MPVRLEEANKICGILAVARMQTKAMVLAICVIFLVSVGGAIATSATVQDMDNDANIREEEAPPIEIGQKSSEPIHLASQRKMLIDRTHGEKFDVSGFTGYLVSQGWAVDQLSTGPITISELEGYDIFLIPPCVVGVPTSFSNSEIDAIKAYVEDGGGIWVFNEYNRDTAVNSVTQEFGVTFNNDMVHDPTDNVEGNLNWSHIHILETHSITEGVESFSYYAGCSLNVDMPSEIIAKGDDDAYSIYYTSYPPVLAAVEYGSGKGVFCGDITPLHPHYYLEKLTAEEELLLSNIVDWLLAEETVFHGDVNHDGSVTPADATIVLDLAVHGERYTEADVSGDNRVTSLDALMILQAAAGAISL